MAVHTLKIIIVNIARFIEYIWSFFNFMHEKIRQNDPNLPIFRQSLFLTDSKIPGLIRLTHSLKFIFYVLSLKFVKKGYAHTVGHGLTILPFLHQNYKTTLLALFMRKSNCGLEKIIWQNFLDIFQ